jgi:hypothetical protein
MARRLFLRRVLAAVGLPVLAGIGYGIDQLAAEGAAPPRGGRRSTTTTTTEPPAETTVLPSGVTVPTAGWVQAENARPGTLDWVVTGIQSPRSIEGFAGAVSAVVGDNVPLFVSTRARSFHVEAYRMGFYRGLGGRLVWRSDSVIGAEQPAPTLVPGTNTVECQWHPSLTVRIAETWPPGAYLLKLVGEGGEQQFVPLCVRDDESRAAFVVQHSVTTWQAYNLWGGYSLYYGLTGGGRTFAQSPAGKDFAHRSRVVSFDRPYPQDWAQGSSDFMGNEFPLVYDMERLGLDVTYATDVDLHRRPDLLLQHRCLFSLGHDEYWSLEMRQGAAQARDVGVNLAFLGANACYRAIRLEPSPVGSDRRQVCYKSAAEDPLSTTDPARATAVMWAAPPTSWPESELIGSMYQDVEANADLVVADASSWFWAGTGVQAGQRVPQVVEGEYDRFDASRAGPHNVEILAHSPVANRGPNRYSDVTWYTVPGGGGVLATGSAAWVNKLASTQGVPSNVLPAPLRGVTPLLLRVMENVYSVLGTGPASIANPSKENWEQLSSSSTASTPGATPSA